MRWALPASLTRWLLLFAAALGVNAAVSYANLTTLVSNEARVAHTYRVLRALEHLRLVMVDAETGQRGFLLTGEERYLEPYNAALGQVASARADMRRLIADNPEQQARLETLDALINRRLVLLEETVDLRRSGLVDEATDLVRSGRGRVVMDEIRATIATMEVEEERLLALRAAESRASSQIASATFALASLAGIALVGGLGLVIARDVTARRRAAEALRTEREWFAVTLASIGDAVIATDVSGRVTFMNAVAESLTGWSAADAAGQDITEVFRIVNEETRRAVESPVVQVLREGKVVGLANHTILITRAGGEVPIDDSGAPIRGPDGAVAGAVLVFRDIAERRSAENRQQVLDDTTAALASSLDVETTIATVAELLVPRLADLCVVYLTGPDGTLRRVASAHVDGARAEQLRALHPIPIDGAGPHPAAAAVREGQTLLNPPIQRGVIDEVAMSEEQRAAMAALIPTDHIVTPLVARQHVIGALSLGVLGDSRRYAEEDLPLAEEVARRVALAVDNASLYRDARQAVRLRDSFLSIAAHELKTPLTALLGQAQLLSRRVARDGGMSERDARTVKVIAAQAVRLNRMIAELLDVSRLEQGQFSLTYAPVDLVELARQVADEVRPTLLDHELELALPDEPLTVRGDALRLEQVLQNLVSNAVKYSLEGGPVTLSVARRGDRALVAVSDRGLGIPPDAQARVFERFFRASNAESSYVTGMGVGLYVVQEIVTLHGGSVSVASAEGQGSTFTVSLPLGDG